MLVYQRFGVRSFGNTGRRAALRWVRKTFVGFAAVWHARYMCFHPSNSPVLVLSLPCEYDVLSPLLSKTTWYAPDAGDYSRQPRACSTHRDAK